MISDTITVNRNTYESWQSEILELRQKVKILEKSANTNSITVLNNTQSIPEKILSDIAINLPGAIFQFTIRNGIWQVDYISDFIWDLARVSATEMIQDFSCFLQRVHPEDMDSFVASVEKAVNNFLPWHYDGRLIHPNGEIRWYQGDSTPTKNQQGEVVLCGVLLDITARKQAEEESQKKINTEIDQIIVTMTEITEHKKVEEERQILISLVENSSDFIGVADMTGKLIFINEAGLKLVGLDSRESVKDLHIRDFLLAEDHNFHQQDILPMLIQTGTWQGEGRFRHFQTGEAIAVEINRFLVKNAQTGEPLGLATITRDIRQRQKADAQLKEQEQFLRSIFEGFAQIVFIVDILENGEMVYSGWNSLAEELTGLSQADVIGKSPEYILGMQQGAEIRQRYLKCIESGVSISYEELLSIKDEPTWWFTRINPLKDHKNRIYRLVGTTVNITEHKQAEKALKASQHFVQSIADSSPHILYIYDLKEQRSVYTNRELTVVLGYSPTEIEQMEPSGILNIIHVEDREHIKDRLKKFATAKDGETFEFEFRVRRANSEWCWLYSRETVFSRTANGKVKQILCVATNITERKVSELKLQEQTKNLQNALRNLKTTQVQLIQSEKMSSIGSMVAGIAHEINNPVNFIHGNLIPADEYIQDLLGLLELYQESYPNPTPEIQAEIQNIELEFLKEDLMKILKSMHIGTDRIREIVLSLRNFSRLDEAECKLVNIHDGIDSTLMILQNRLKAKPHHPEISVIKEYGNIPLIDCYPGQLNQVFMNIISNAIDVLEKPSLGKLGKINIRTEILEPDQIVIRISDNGLGIPRENLSKLFDPFFTTKDVGKGTGLGLSISYQIVVEKHRGKLYCQSELGAGTEFVIQIPITQPEALN